MLKFIFLASLISLVSCGIASNNFELDGNPNSDGLEDWDLVSDVFSGVIADPAPQSIFTGGGSKDTRDVSHWQWTDGSVPDKDDITNAYAHASIENGKLLIYFGADRFANNGDSAVGFWFFQDEVSPLQDGTFSGVHVNNDLLVIANFGSSEEIFLYKWFDGSLVQVITGQEGNDATCDSSLNQTACAIANANPESSPWSYVPKAGVVDVFPEISFVEGGIILSNIFMDQIPCFTTFLAVTRSSSTPNAQLKDFVLGEFDVCDIDVSIDCFSAELSNDTRSVIYTYNVSVTNNGFGVVYNIEVSSDQVLASLGSLAVSDTHMFTLTFVEDSLTASAGPITVSATPTPDPNGEPITETTGTSQCPVLNPVPNVDISKLCNVVLDIVNGLVVVKVEYSGSVCNIGELVLDGIVVGDDKDGVINLGTLKVNECSPYSGSYYPLTNITVPSDASFEDTVMVLASPSFDLPTVGDMAHATCPLCP